MTAPEITATGCVAGYASPIGVAGRALVVVDELVAQSANLVSGANEEGWHLRNVSVGRDYQPDLVADLSAVEEGQPCADCGAPLHTERSVEVGNIFKLGTRYSMSMGANYVAEDGSERPIVMGSYGIGVGRLFACIAEEHGDDRGLCWPASVAPYGAHICVLDPEGARAAPDITALLEEAGTEVLVDDRGERAGVQFADAELIGCPVQLTASRRSLAAGGVELKLRRDPSRSVDIVALRDVVARTKAGLLP